MGKLLQRSDNDDSDNQEIGVSVPKAKAFLSWSTADPRIRELAPIFKGWLNALLETRVEFFFSREIEPGEASISNIYRGLNDADLGFVLLSHRTARSPWVVYESGCLNPSLREGKVFPLLFDLTPTELREVCPPLADFQAVSLRDRYDMLRLILKVARLIGLDDTETIALRERFADQFVQLERAIAVSVDRQRVLPDRFLGTIAFNDNISSSENFRLPEIFSNYRRELLLVGINLNALLNLTNRTGNFERMLDSLLEDPQRRIRILVADLWDEKIMYTYDKIVFGAGEVELRGLSTTYFEASSKYHIANVVLEHCGTDGFERIRQQLTIKRIGLLADTFWFVDADGTRLEGDMMFALMTTATGRERPAYYISQQRNPALFSKYFDMCRAAFDLTDDFLWPVAESPAP